MKKIKWRNKKGLIVRILELRFKNLNSLYGQWTLDFTRPEYVQDGIFVITGPTGAGKSTLLDAICLALYGRTPRLKSISKTSNEIMSRQSGECFAEVTFETNSGRFCSHWSQHRARRKSDGNLGESKHEISDAATGSILASQKRKTAARIIKETGMDFDRFTRSMLLAQGGFAAFLQAAPDKRAPILEQITGTDIYSEISKKVHERLKAEDKKLELLHARIGGIQVLSEEEEKVFGKELSEKQNREKEYQKQDDELSTSIAWLANMESLKKELLQLDKASKEASTEQAAFETDRLKLKKALKAAELESGYATLLATRQQQKNDFTSLKKLKTKIPYLEKTLKLKQAELESAQKKLDGTKVLQKQELVLMKEIRAMDLEISQKQKIEADLRQECLKIEARVSEEKGKNQQALNDQVKIEKRRKGISDYLVDHREDEGLPIALAAMQGKIESLGETSSAIKRLSMGMVATEKQKTNQTELYKKHQKVLGDFTLKHEHAGRKIILIKKEMEAILDKRSLSGYRREYEGLMREMVYKRKIANLEEERAHLVDGKACPLCGSQDHPFAKGLLPKEDETQEKIKTLAIVIKKLEAMEKELETAREKDKASGLERQKAEKDEVEYLHQMDRLEEDIARFEKELENQNLKKARLEKEIISTLEPFGVKKIIEKDFDVLRQNLETRIKIFQAHQEKKSALEKELSDISAKIKKWDGVLSTLADSLADKKEVLKSHQKLLADHIEKRVRQFGEKDPDAEEIRLETEKNRAQKTTTFAQTQKDEIDRQLITQKARAKDLQTALDARQPELEECEKIFFQNLIKAGFQDENAVVSSILPADEKNNLAKKAQALDEKKRNIAARQDERETQLEKEKAKKLSARPIEYLKDEQDKIRPVLKQLGEDIGALKQKFSDNIEAKIRIEKQIKEINACKKERSRWDALHFLIGSADGKKYRNFAQGITFELMVSHANQQLEKMSDRYLLIRDDKQPLELNIVDDYQAGEIRSTKNLSGGESFVVSLSLALGLSNMASRNVRVDSLFLDEGFGTLDEDALETALQALSSLHSSGKLIGVISHVPALKESINTQIKISPISGGKSHISGPGCNIS